MENYKQDLKNLGIGLGVIILYLIATLFASDIINIFITNFNSLNNLAKSICIILYESLLTTIVVYIYRNDFIPDFKDFLKNNIIYFKKYIKYWFIILGLMFLSNIIITNFTTTQIANNQENIIKSFRDFPIYTFIVTVFIAPILEELVFRLSFKKLFSRTNFLFILFSGLVFGSLHVLTTCKHFIDLLFIIPYSIPGFIFAYLYTKSKNIFVPISLHFIHNGIMMCLQILLLFLI